MKKEFNEELKCLFNYLECCISNDAYNVLTDSNEDPQYSAVTTNVIKYYMTIRQALGEPVPYHTVEEYLCTAILSKRREAGRNYIQRFFSCA